MNVAFSWRPITKKEFQELGIELEFVQDNHSRSKKGTLRGLHFQKKFPQAKLVRVIRAKCSMLLLILGRTRRHLEDGSVLLLSEEKKRQLFIPEGFAHGFLALTEIVEFTYKCSDYYHPNDEGGITWNDSDIAIDWR